MSRLMERADWARAVFERDEYRCVSCGAPAVDAHHLLERRLWPDGGYYLPNGVALCASCHLRAEQTLLSVEELREAAGIREIVLPPHLEESEKYDKWGNPLLGGGTRGKGELFFEEPVQKVLRQAGLLDIFVPYTRYPRTYHLTFSPGRSKDDKVLPSHDHLQGKRVIVTEKMDGESASVYRNYYHARSPDGRHHPSRDWMKRFVATWQYELPEEWRVVGEYLYAQHSIGYADLPSYFLMFQIWNERNVIQSWGVTEEWADLLGLDLVPLLYDGVFDEGFLRDLGERLVAEGKEGFVVRVWDEFPLSQFRWSTGKFVRAGHVQTDTHWMHSEIVPNRLKGE